MYWIFFIYNIFKYVSPQSGVSCVFLVRLRDIGLEQYDTVELFARILLPAVFLLACILQLHYFNSDFLSLTDLENISVLDKSARCCWLRHTAHSHSLHLVVISHVWLNSPLILNLTLNLIFAYFLLFKCKVLLNVFIFKCIYLTVYLFTFHFTYLYLLISCHSFSLSHSEEELREKLTLISDTYGWLYFSVTLVTA